MNNVQVFLSKQFSLSKRDYWRSLIVAALTAALTAGWEAIESVVNSGGEFSWSLVARAAVVAGGGYLIKNLFIEPTKVITTVPTERTGVGVQEEIISTLSSKS